MATGIVIGQVRPLLWILASGVEVPAYWESRLPAMCLGKHQTGRALSPRHPRGRPEQSSFRVPASAGSSLPCPVTVAAIWRVSLQMEDITLSVALPFIEINKQVYISYK